MYRVSEIERSRPARQLYDLTHRRERIYILRKQVELEGFDKILRVDILLGSFDQGQEELFNRFSKLVETFIVVASTQLTLFVFPMCRHTFFGDLMHILRTNLHLKRLAAVTDDRSMKRLIQVISWNGDPISKAFGYGGPNVVNYA